MLHHKSNPDILKFKQKEEENKALFFDMEG